MTRFTITCWFILSVAFVLTLPSIVLAQETFADFIALFIDFIRAALPIVMILALLALIWGGAKFIRGVGSDERAEGKYVLFWGTIALFMMVAIWGIVTLIVETFIGGT